MSHLVRYSLVMRGDQITRVLKLVHLLQGGGRTLQQLRAELNVTKRTIQRDIAVLEQAGFPIVSAPRNRSVVWRLAYNPTEEMPLDLTLQERMALYFSRGLLKPLAGTPFFDAIESAQVMVSRQQASISSWLSAAWAAGQWQDERDSRHALAS